jgi:hypothetical protein
MKRLTTSTQMTLKIYKFQQLYEVARILYEGFQFSGKRNQYLMKKTSQGLARRTSRNHHRSERSVWFVNLPRRPTVISTGPLAMPWLVFFAEYSVQFPKRCVSCSLEEYWMMDNVQINPVIPHVIHHRHKPLESIQRVVLPQ